jgi:tryptophan synthase alpha chain
MQLICYLSNGYPSIEKTLNNAADYITGGCDIIEIDLPTDNPFLDNQLIQNRMVASYNSDPTLNSQSKTVVTLHDRYPNQKIIILAYEKTIKEYGEEKFASLANKIQAESVILIAPENDKIKKFLMKEGVKVASYIQFHLPEKEIEEARDSNGFIYLQAKPGNEIKEGFESLDKIIKYLREERGFTQPIYCGVGISTKEDVKMVKAAGGDGVFIGSGLLKKEQEPNKMVGYLKGLKSEAH